MESEIQKNPPCQTSGFASCPFWQGSPPRAQKSHYPSASFWAVQLTIDDRIIQNCSFQVWQISPKFIFSSAFIPLSQSSGLQSSAVKTPSTCNNSPAPTSSSTPPSTSRAGTSVETEIEVRLYSEFFLTILQLDLQRYPNPYFRWGSSGVSVPLSPSNCILCKQTLIPHWETWGSISQGKDLQGIALFFKRAPTFCSFQHLSS